MLTSISRWLTKSRRSTALAMLFFAILFLASIPISFLARNVIVVKGPTYAADDSNSGQSAEVGVSPRSEPNRLLALTSMVSAVGGVIGTLSTVFLAWRADRRTAKESDLKLVQLQQQIKELELKLNAQPTQEKGN